MRAELIANDAISLVEAHDWPTALKGALQACGECAAKASLHKPLGLTCCHSGDLVNGERDLRYSEWLKAGDPDVQRALELIRRAEGSHG